MIERESKVAIIHYTMLLNALSKLNEPAQDHHTTESTISHYLYLSTSLLLPNTSAQLYASYKWLKHNSLCYTEAYSEVKESSQSVSYVKKKLSSNLLIGMSSETT